MSRNAWLVPFLALSFLTLLYGSAWAAGPTAQDVATMLNNVVTDLSRLFSRDSGQGSFVRVLTFFIGGLFFISGLLAFSSRNQVSGGLGGVPRIVAGILLMSFFTILDMGSNSLFSRNASEILSSAGGGSSPSQIAGAATRTAIFLIQAVGIVAAIRAVTLVYGMSEGGNKHTAGSIATLFISGLACINVVAVLGFIANTLGGPAPGYLRDFLGNAGISI